MGKEKTTETVVQSGTQTYQPTEMEKELQKKQLAQYEQVEPSQTQYYLSGYDLATQLLRGGELPGYLSNLPTGISESTIGEQATQYALSAMPGMQKLGLTNSGTAAKSIAGGIASDILLPVQEYNTNLLLSLLNLASGQASTGTGQFTGGTNTLAQALAGQGTTSTTSTGTTTQTSMNPFLKSFQQSLGQTLGSPSFSMGPFSF